MIETNEWMLFLAGLLGGGHCVGMCGGIVTALTLHIPQETNRWSIILAYNVGRIGSYVLIGTLLGWLAATGLTLFNIHNLQLALGLLANLILVIMGCYLSGLSRAAHLIEQLGLPIWRRLAPLLSFLLPVRSPRSALLAGMIWGWLPCGLVYSASLSALATGSALGGAFAMLAFGLGTLPNLLLIGGFADNLRRWIQQRAVRLTTGLAIASIGAWQFLQTFN